MYENEWYICIRSTMEFGPHHLLESFQNFGKHHSCHLQCECLQFPHKRMWFAKVKTNTTSETSSTKGQ